MSLSAYTVLVLSESSGSSCPFFSGIPFPSLSTSAMVSRLGGDPLLKKVDALSS